jgi:hypothetical protein
MARFGSSQGGTKPRNLKPQNQLTVEGATPKVTIGDAGAEDTMLIFDGNAVDYRIGLDDGTDKLEIGVGLAHGSNIAIGVDSSAQVTKLNLAAAAVAVADDHIVILDGGATGAPKAESIQDLLSAIAGSGISVSGNQLVADGGGTADSVAADDISLGNAAVSLATNSGNVTIDSNAGSVSVDGHTGLTLTSSNSGEVDITSAANVDINATTGITVDGTTLSIDGTDDSNLTVTASGKDLDIAVAGGGTQELRLASAGTGASALHLNASAGSVDIDSADAITVDAADEIVITTTSADGHISLVSAHTSGLAFHIDANADAASEVQIDAGILDIDVTAGVTIDGTTLSIDGTDDSNLTVTASGKDLDIAVAGGGTQELRLASAGTGTAALHLNASAGGIDIDSADMIDIDAADEITIDTTSADGHIAITSAHTAGDSILISANAHAGSILDVDAGILDIDVQAAATIDAVGIALGAGSGELDLTTTGTLDVNANALDMDLTDSSSITITSSEAAEDLTIEQVGGNDSSIIIQAAGTGADAIKLNASAGSIDIDSADNITVDAADDISITSTSADGLITIHSAHEAGQSILIDANAHAGSILDIDAGVLDIDVQAATTIDTSTLTVTTDTATFTSANANDPLVVIKNTTNDADGAILRFVKDKGAAGAANDVNGLIQFFGDDANQDNIKFAEIKSQVKVHTNGQEGGKFTISVAEHDGTSTAGLVVEDGDADGELDVTIGAGASSVTTIAGTLDLGDRNITNVGDIDLDSVSVADAASGLNLDFSGANTGTGKVTLADNLASALVFTESTNPYMTFITTDSSEVVMFTQDVQITDDKKLHFGTNKDWSIEYDEDGDNDLKMTGDTLTIASANSQDPLVIIKNTTNDANGARLHFVKDKGAAGADGDDIGVIEFIGDDAGQAQTTFAKIVAEVSEADNTDEAGKLSLFVAESDGTDTALTAGLVLEGEHATDGQVDATIGAGAASTTTVAGDLAVTSDATIGDDLSLTSDSSVFNMGDGNDFTITHDGTTGATIAGNPIIVDSGGNLTLDAHTGIFILKDAGSEVLRLTEGNSGDVTVKLATDGKDLVFTDNGDATNMKILDAAAGINVPGEVQTTKIAFTDGDDAITIADTGLCTFSKKITASGGLAVTKTALARSSTSSGVVTATQDDVRAGTITITMASGHSIAANTGFQLVTVTCNEVDVTDVIACNAINATDGSSPVNASLSVRCVQITDGTSFALAVMNTGSQAVPAGGGYILNWAIV